MNMQSKYTATLLNYSIDKLQQMYYCACMSRINSAHKNDTEAVKALRDNVSWDMFEKKTSELNKQELIKAIAFVNSNVNVIKIEYATNEQKRKYNYLTISTALVYYDFNTEYMDSDTGLLMQGNELREYCLRLFNKKKTLPENILDRIFTDYINPKSNDFLIKHDYKARQNTNMKKLYVHKLSKEEMLKLIQYYEQIVLTTNQRKVKFTDPVLN